MFTVIEDAWAIVVSKGVYRQVKVYERGGRIYVGHGSGFIAAYSQGRTGLPNVRWDDVHVPSDHKFDGLGRMEIAA